MNDQCLPLLLIGVTTQFVWVGFYHLETHSCTMQLRQNVDNLQPCSPIVLAPCILNPNPRLRLAPNISIAIALLLCVWFGQQLQHSQALSSLALETTSSKDFG